VQHPFERVDHLGERGQFARDRDGIDQDGARACPPELQQVGAVRVPEAGRALGIDRERAGAPGESIHGRGQQPGRVDELGEPACGGQERHGGALGGLVADIGHEQ
jgi:hypothetical protein